MIHLKLVPKTKQIKASVTANLKPIHSTLLFIATHLTDQEAANKQAWSLLPTQHPFYMPTCYTLLCRTAPFKYICPL
jgi:hypothetical protein